MSYCRHTTSGVYMIATHCSEVDAAHLECLGCTLENGAFPSRCFVSAKRALDHLKDHALEGAKVDKAIVRLEQEIADGLWERAAKGVT